MNHRGSQFEAGSVNNEAEIRPTGITALRARQIIRCINASGQTINVATSPFYPCPFGRGTDADYSSEQCRAAVPFPPTRRRPPMHFTFLGLGSVVFVVSVAPNYK
jgi:hypothetical protein